MEYNVDVQWPVTTLTEIDEFFRMFIYLKFLKYAFHGEHKNWNNLVSSLDIQSLSIADETKLLDDFYAQTFLHLRPAERKYLEDARVWLKTTRTTATVFVGQHFGLPTRAVDWTRNVYAALYIACRRSPNEDGVIWYMNESELTKGMEDSWPVIYGKTELVEDAFQADFMSGKDRNGFLRLDFPAETDREKKQSAFITISDRLRTDHAVAISQLGIKTCGRIIIPHAYKRSFLEKIDQLGINGYSLGLGEATVETICRDLLKEGFGKQ